MKTKTFISLPVKENIIDIPNLIEKDKSYQERQQAREELKDLLTRFNSDDLVYMIMNLEDKKN